MRSFELPPKTIRPRLPLPTRKGCSHCTAGWRDQRRNSSAVVARVVFVAKNVTQNFACGLANLRNIGMFYRLTPFDLVKQPQYPRSPAVACDWKAEARSTEGQQLLRSARFQS